MKTTRQIASLIAASVLTLATVSAFADDVNYPNDNFTSATAQKTRTEVKAELNQAQQSHSLEAHAVNYPRLAPTVSRSREQVRAELKASQLSRENDVVIGQ